MGTGSGKLQPSEQVSVGEFCKIVDINLPLLLNKMTMVNQLYIRYIVGIPRHSVELLCNEICHLGERLLSPEIPSSHSNLDSLITTIFIC